MQVKMIQYFASYNGSMFASYNDSIFCPTGGCTFHHSFFFTQRGARIDLPVSSFLAERQGRAGEGRKEEGGGEIVEAGKKDNLVHICLEKTFDQTNHNFKGIMNTF